MSPVTSWSEGRVRCLAAAPGILLALITAGCGRHPPPDGPLDAAHRHPTAPASLAITYPLPGAVFPPDIAPPTVRWTDPQAPADTWRVEVRFAGSTNRMGGLTREPCWTPRADEWETFKRQSVETPATVIVAGVTRTHPERVLSTGQVAVATSRDPVGAPLFYREVNLPFIEAVKDPSRIRWRFGPVSLAQPAPVVLENLPVCGNCHSFPRDGRVLAMDVDYGNNKGSYVITAVAEHMRLTPENMITWDDFRRGEGDSTLGLLSQISPDGRHVVSTVKDQSVFVDKPGLEFSQLFFPVKGILAVYDRQQKSFGSLPGADDPRYVQSNPAWSPDGRHLVFARAPVHDLRVPGVFQKVLLSAEECREFVIEGKPFLYDLYRIPFNGGRGGTPEPLAGASHNGRSNFFPKYSPDGRWIVFCRAATYMLLQPDSQLWIVPAEGGVARRLEGNTGRMNSWHSWSPNGRWLVFSSKANGPYTQLWLTHLDQHGASTPPVVLDHLSAPDRAVNIPEFVPLPATAIRGIREQFLNDYSFVRAGNAFYKRGDAAGAIRQYRQALRLNPTNAHAHQRLGFLLSTQARQPAEGLHHTREALRLDPANGSAHYDLAMALASEWDLGPASPTPQLETVLRHFHQALRLGPENIAPYLPADMLYAYGRTLIWNRQFKDAAHSLDAATRLDPSRPQAYYLLAIAQAHLGLIQEPRHAVAQARNLDPDIDRSVVLHDRLGMNCARNGAFADALVEARTALRLAQTARQTALAESIRQRIALYEQGHPWIPPETPTSHD
ncbi:MAG: tetratricopeptide repeat protein [Verrucomicrobia bacterium]|nr:tetratricopeptide repeat protein [Verrucomicrobiota bacterium]